MTSRTAVIARAGLAALALVAVVSTAAAQRDGGSNGGGDAWLRSELQNPRFIQPYGYASPNYTEYRPFYGYGYPYTPYGDPRLVRPQRR